VFKPKHCALFPIGVFLLDLTLAKSQFLFWDTERIRLFNIHNTRDAANFGVKIVFRLSLPNADALSVGLSKSEVVVQPGDVFEVSLSIKNKSKQPVNARIDHMIEPLEAANYLDLVECGFLVPVTLHPETNQQYSARYLLREAPPNGVHQLSLTYNFKLRRVLGAK
jgi:cytochrome c oxidase assembly protein Cox11